MSVWESYRFLRIPYCILRIPYCVLRIPYCVLLCPTDSLLRPTDSLLRSTASYGALFWKKNYFLNEKTPARAKLLEDLKKELVDKGYEVRYYPYHELPGDIMYGYRPENTKIKVKPSETGKTVIIIEIN